MVPEELYGQDVLLDDTMQGAIAANGEVVVSTGTQTVLQDIKLRLFTPLGGLFYDKNFGSRIIEFVKDENTSFTRQALAVEVKKRIALDPRVVKGSVSAKILSWDDKGVKIDTRFKLIGETNVFNFIIQVDSNLEMVIKDVNPN